MMDYGVATYTRETVAEKGDLTGVTVPVKMGSREKVDAAVGKGLTLLMRSGQKDKLSFETELPEYLTAPVEEGQILGKVTFSVKDRVVGSCFLRAKQAVEKLSFSDMLLWMLSALARRPDTAANADLTNTGK